MSDTMTPPLSFTIVGSGEVVELTDYVAVVAGYTGRDAAAVQHHIDELAAQGIAPPEQVPMFYPVDAALVTQQEDCEVGSSGTCGECEPVLVRADGRLFLAVGSDHTDRDLERESVALSKAACVKPVSRMAIEVTADLSWDDLHLRSWVDGVLYQESAMASLRVPTETLALWEAAPQTGDLVMFAGTVPILGGTFVPGHSWRVSITLPEGPELEHHYTVTERTS